MCNDKNSLEIFSGLRMGAKSWRQVFKSRNFNGEIHFQKKAFNSSENIRLLKF